MLDAGRTFNLLETEEGIERLRAALASEQTTSR
jgi:hypothetical protein